MSQADFAPLVPLAKNTLGNYERGDREIGAEALAGLVRLGWNANWLLTGEGPERLDQVAEPRGAYVSQDLSAQDLSIALQLADRKIASAGKAPTRDQYAAFVLSIYEAITKGLPEADVLDFTTGQRTSTSDEDQADDGRQGVGEARRRAAGGDAGATGTGER